MLLAGSYNSLIPAAGVVHPWWYRQCLFMLSVHDNLPHLGSTRTNYMAREPSCALSGSYIHLRTFVSFADMISGPCIHCGRCNTLPSPCLVAFCDTWSRNHDHGSRIQAVIFVLRASCCCSVSKALQQCLGHALAGSSLHLPFGLEHHGRL